jgi:hypothetical protein
VSRYLEERIAELSEEIRSYPTPIAGCDLHLPALLEERAALLSQLNKEGPCGADALWTNDGGCNAT